MSINPKTKEAQHAAIGDAHLTVYVSQSISQSVSQSVSEQLIFRMNIPELYICVFAV